MAKLTCTEAERDLIEHVIKHHQSNDAYRTTFTHTLAQAVLDERPNTPEGRFIERMRDLCDRTDDQDIQNALMLLEAELKASKK